jgi:hypothetical protein
MIRKKQSSGTCVLAFGAPCVYSSPSTSITQLQLVIPLPNMQRQVRRASGAANHLPPTTLAVASRTNIHRPQDSQHLHPGPVGGASMSDLFGGSVAGPNQAIMQLLINRIKNKVRASSQVVYARSC